mmetsp:Transcript_29247/g.63612  ORF Transcript_29247/g.63612 Transcript_29247/m.63612 type:complete len:118 (+) Transcript_29247:83-436(+)
MRRRVLLATLLILFEFEPAICSFRGPKPSGSGPEGSTAGEDVQLPKTAPSASGSIRVMRYKRTARAVEASDKLLPDAGFGFESEHPQEKGGLWDFDAEPTFAAPDANGPKVVPIGLL